MNILRLLHSGKVTIHNSEWWQLDYMHDSIEDLIHLIDSYGDVLYTFEDQEIVFVNYPTSTCIKLVCIDPHEMDKCHFYLRYLSYVTPEHLLLEDLGINSKTLLGDKIIMANPVQAWQASDGQLFLTKQLMLDHERDIKLKSLNISWREFVDSRIMDTGWDIEYGLQKVSDHTLNSVIEYLKLEQEKRY